jgi:DNA-binding NarL/FixJ family response regulator
MDGDCSDDLTSFSSACKCLASDTAMQVASATAAIAALTAGFTAAGGAAAASRPAGGDGHVQRLASRLIRKLAGRPEPGAYASPELLDPLSGREPEVLAEVAGGWSNSEIGERLHISAATAKTHVSRLLMKLGAHDRAQLVMIAYETGLVTSG